MRYCQKCGKPLNEKKECNCGFIENTKEEMIKILEKLGFVSKDHD